MFIFLPSFPLQAGYFDSEDPSKYSVEIYVGSQSIIKIYSKESKEMIYSK